jgi:hypothetical protein
MLGALPTCPPFNVIVLGLDKTFSKVAKNKKLFEI